MRFTFVLARELGMSRRRLLQEMDAKEIAQWQALMLLEARELEAVRKKDTLKSMAGDGAADVKRRLKHGRSRHGGN